MRKVDQHEQGKRRKQGKHWWHKGRLRRHEGQPGQRRKLAEHDREPIGRKSRERSPIEVAGEREKRCDINRSDVPTGRQLLGEIVSAFKLYDVLDPHMRAAIGKRGQRFFSQGENVKAPCRVIHLAGWALAGTPICECSASASAPQAFEPVLFERPPSAEMSRLLLLSAHAHALAWDRDVRPFVTKRHWLPRAFLRFATLDFAVKTAELRALENRGAPVPGERPAWAGRSRRGEPVAHFMDARGAEETIERLEERLGVEGLKKWRRGHRPKAENLKALVDALVPIEERAKAWADLSRHYALSELCEKIRPAFGDDFLADLVTTHLAVVTCHMLNQPTSELLRQVNEARRPYLLAFSSWLVFPETFVRIAVHHAPHWVDDIQEATALWGVPAMSDHPVRQILDVLNHAAALHGQGPLDKIFHARMRGNSEAPSRNPAGSSQP